MTNYDLSFMDTSNTLADVWTGVFTLHDGIGIAILSLIFIVSFASGKTFDNNVRFILSSFFTSIIGALMFFGSFVAWYVAVIPTILLVISIIIEFFKR